MQCGQTRESHRPAAAAVFLLAVTLAATAGPAAAIISPGWAFPLTMTRDELAVVCGSGRDWLDMWMSADLDYVRSDDGIRGEVDYGIDVWLRDSDALAENARVTKSTGPMIRCSSVDIEIYSPTDASRRVVSEKNLAWRSVLEGGDGVITLDRMQYTAVIPGLKVGDRLRLVWHQEWVRGHGMPVVTLRGLAGGPAHAAVRLQVPDSQKLIYALAGATDLADSVSYWGDTTHGSTVGFWEFREAPRHAGQPRNTDDKVLTLVTHVAPAAGGSAVTASFVGAADWEQAARGYRQRIEPLLQPSMEMKALAMELIAGKTTSRERIAALYDHVQSTTRYLGLYTGEGGIIPAAADVTRRLGYGDCKGLSTYLIALCRAVDIPAWPVVLMVDRNRTLAADIPNMGQFNHFIALGSV